MAAEAFEDSIELNIGLLEAIETPSLAPGNPFPMLASAGKVEPRTCGSVILENEFLRVTALPGLGGRIVSLFDKRTSTELMPLRDLTPQPGGARGIELGFGLQIRLGAEDRPNSLGPVSHLITPPSEEDEASCWFHESVTGNGLSIHWKIELPSERAELLLEVRVLNRSFKPVPYNGGLAVALAGDGFEMAGSAVVYDAGLGTGLAITSDELEFALKSSTGLAMHRFDRLRALMPRQVDTWTATITPISSLKGVSGWSREGACFLEAGLVQLQTVHRTSASTLVMQLADGQVFEAKSDLHPEHLLSIPLDPGAAPPARLAWRDQSGIEVLRADVAEQRKLEGKSLASPEPLPRPPIDLIAPSKDLRRARFDMTWRALAYLLEAHRETTDAKLAEADFLFEQALAYNADDPLTWWGKAVGRRKSGGSDEPPVELLNAHYLAPLEPLLKAEAFLGQPVQPGREVSPLLASLSELDFLEVASTLIELKYFEDAARWIDEAIRHRDLPMLRYLYGYALLSHSRMEVEAAQQIQVAGKLPFAPPFPFRDIELRALSELKTRFPQDGLLERYLAMAKSTQLAEVVAPISS